MQRRHMHSCDGALKCSPQLCSCDVHAFQLVGVLITNGLQPLSLLTAQLLSCEKPEY